MMSKASRYFTIVCLYVNKFKRVPERFTYWLVSHAVVPPEEARGDEVGNDDVYSVVIMSKKDAEHTNDAECPAPPVIAPEAFRRVCQTGNGN